MRNKKNNHRAEAVSLRFFQLSKWKMFNLKYSSNNIKQKKQTKWSKTSGQQTPHTVLPVVEI